MTHYRGVSASSDSLANRGPLGRRSSRCDETVSGPVATLEQEFPQRFFSVKQILSPLVVGAANHAHDVAAGVEREWTRLFQQLHFSLAQQMIPLPAVAGMAAGHQVFPCG